MRRREPGFDFFIITSFFHVMVGGGTIATLWAILA